MNLFDALERQVATLRDLHIERAEQVRPTIRALDDERLLTVARAAAALAREANQIETVAAAVIAERSTRSEGQDGLAQKLGHRNVTDLLQSLTGRSRASTHRQIRVGKALLEAEPLSAHAPTELPWHAPLGDAVVSGRLSVAQNDAVRVGIGEPPPPSTTELDAARAIIATQAIEIGEAMPAPASPAEYPATLWEHAYVVTPEHAEAVAAASIREAWSAAATQLLAEAQVRTVEELRAQARLMRDQLDPAGAERRFRQRFEARSFRRWTTADGVQHGSIAFDDEGAAEFAAIFDTALRPRRGGPRFVGSDEAERARILVDDPRTNDQLAYDLLLDLVGGGAKADAASVLGTKMAGVRVVTVQGSPASSYAEDGLTALPESVVDRRVCNTGVVRVDVDAAANPLNVGHTHRLFTSAQRIALGIRDGGCRWDGCDRQASYCEAHHIDPFGQGGRTDVDRGILLCRFHHMQLHHGGWRITREKEGDFVLHSPAGNAVNLEPRLALRRTFAHVAPPAARFRGAETKGKDPPGG